LFTLLKKVVIGRQLSQVEKLKLIRIFAEVLDTNEDITPLQPFKTYDLPTLSDIFGAGAMLMEAIKPVEPS
jgi:hypothetical protein